MTSKINAKSNTKLIFLILAVVILIILNLIIFTKKIVQPEMQLKQQEQDNDAVSQAQNDKKNEQDNVKIVRTDEEIVEMLSGYNERDRMEFYCGEYFRHILKGEYDAAYNLLYSEFKQQYFPTVEAFEEYAKKTYPTSFALDYDDITRQGDIYVLRLIILDMDGTKETEKTQRVVIKENSYNNYVISFQVI